MIRNRPQSAGILSVILAFVIITLIYAAFGRVDLIFKFEDGTEICRQENVCAVSSINDPIDSIPEGTIGEDEEIQFYFVDCDEKVYFTDLSMRLRVKIAKTVVMNFLNFKWGEGSQFVVINAVVYTK